MTAFRKVNPKAILILITLLCMWACNDKKENDVLYKKPIETHIDTTCAWLKDDKNFLDKNYDSLFYNYYRQKIKEKNYLAAAKAMELVAWNKAGYQTFDQPFFETVTFFDAHYRKEIPQIRSSFIDTYFGDYYTDKGEHKKAISYYKKTTEFDVVDYETCFKKADGNRTIAWCYFSLGEQDLSLEYNFKALEDLKKTDNVSAIGSIYTTFAMVYQASKDFKNCEKYLNKSLYYYSKDAKNQQDNIFICLYNKINLYDRSRNFTRMKPLVDSTFLAFKKSNLNNPSIKVSIYYYKIDQLLDNDSIAEGKKLINELKPDVETLNSDATTQQYTVLKAYYEIAQNKGIKDTKLIIEAIPFLLENENFSKARDLYAILSTDAYTKKDYEKALFYEEERNKATDSLGTREMADKVMELNTKYQTEKKEQQIKLQKKTILNKNTTIALLISGLLGILLFAFAISLRRKQKQLRLEKQNAQLYTKQLLEKTEEERKRIASDLHDSVSHELLSLKNTFEEKTDLTNRKIDAIINDIRIISRNLHPIMFDKIGLKASIEQLVERAQSVNSFMVTADIDYTSSLSVSDELQVYRIIQEALSNIIKYADAVAAKITIQEENNTIHIEVKDNGKGFNVAEAVSGSKAFGLHNIIERTRAIGGEAKIISDKTGTIVTLEIKKS